MDISIKTIPNDQHRPGINGADWQFTPEGNLEVRVSKMSDWRYEVCLATHEMVEALMCRYLGVTQEQVDAFDFPIETASCQEGGPKSIEAGDRDDCPYLIPHCFATAIERILAGVLLVPFGKYDDELEAISGNEFKTSLEVEAKQVMVRTT